MWGGMRVQGGRRRAVRCGLSMVSAALAALWLASEASAQDRRPPQTATQARHSLFDIPPQSLTDALALFGRQSGMQVSADAGLVRDIRSAGVRGALSPERALGQLLAGTGITYRLTGANTAVLEHGVPVADSGPMRLSPIKVTAGGDRTAASGSGYQGTPDWVYRTPSSVGVISRQVIERSPTRNARDLLDDVAGVYANRSETQNPGISVNVRGLQDQNRVVTMIDGARQNFQRNAHGSTQRTYVDTSFIRQVEIEKSATSAAGGAGALGGTVNFRTLIADDLIASGRRWGTELNAATGTNAYDFHGSAALAARIGGRVSILGGISHRDIGAYDIGQNGTIEFWEGTYRDAGLLFTGSRTWSGLVKVEADITDKAKLTVGWFRNQTDSSQGVYRGDTIEETFKREDRQDIANNTLTASFEWDPRSDLFHIDSQIWYTRTRNKERRGARFADRLGEFRHIDYELATYGGSLQNTSRFALGSGYLSVNYGVEAFRDDGETATQEMIDDIRGVDLSYGYRGLNPSGRRDVVSGFTNATWEHDDWLTVSGGLRYDHFNLGGTTRIFAELTRTREEVEVLVTEPCFSVDHPVIGPIEICPPPSIRIEIVYGPWEQDTASVDVDLSGGALLPTVLVAAEPFDWLQPFVRYSRSQRPPTVMEAFNTGGHPGGSNNEFAPNPRLEPERGRTWEIGVNLSADGVVLARDALRMKVVGFHRKIEDYINVGRLYRPETDFEYNAYVNLDGITRMKGLEVEASYDAGRFYVGGAFTYLDTDWADSYTFNGESFKSKPSVLFVPPEKQVTIDAGVRVFDERLIAGGRVLHVTQAVPAYGYFGGSYATDRYTVYDLYGSFALNDHVELRLAANNVTDVAYVPALGEWILPAPGRTIIGSLGFSF